MKAPTQDPKLLSAYGLFPYNETLETLCTTESRFGDPILLYKRRGDHLLVPRALCPIPAGSKDMRTLGIPISFTSRFVHRHPEQKRVVEEATELLKRNQSFILQAPTGFGKTAVAMELIARVGRKTLVVVTKEDLRDQWIAAAQKFLGLDMLEVGILQADQVPHDTAKIVVALIQSLSKEGKYEDWPGLKTFGLVIFDEVHRLGADQFNQCAYKLPAMLRLGLSATPQRKDGKDVLIFSHIGPVKVSTQHVTLTPLIIVRSSTWRCPKVPRYIDGHQVYIPLPHEPGKTMHVEKTMIAHPERNRMIVKFVLAALRKERKIILFSSIRKHLDILHDLLVAAGVGSHLLGMYRGGLKPQERELAKTRQVILATYAYTAEATDIPELDTAILATPRADVVQTVGRILRHYHGKRQPVVFDIVDGASIVFKKYYDKRLAWYSRQGSEIRAR